MSSLHELVVRCFITTYPFNLFLPKMTNFYNSVLKFQNNPWGLGTELEQVCRTGPPGYIGWWNRFLLVIDSSAQIYRPSFRIENERFGLVFAQTGSISSGTGLLKSLQIPQNDLFSNKTKAHASHCQYSSLKIRTASFTLQKFIIKQIRMENLILIRNNVYSYMAKTNIPLQISVFLID